MLRVTSRFISLHFFFFKTKRTGGEYRLEFYVIKCRLLLEFVTT